MMSLSTSPLLPGSTIGVFGSGQLGRMLALAGRPMGYRIHTYSPDHNSPTGQVADAETSANYTDADAVNRFLEQVDVVTFEFENVPVKVADLAIAREVPVHPGGWVLHTTQNRLREKNFLAQASLPVALYHPVRQQDDLMPAAETVGLPAVLKTASFGYDGKGQRIVSTPGELAEAWHSLGKCEAVLEQYVDFSHELSVIGARNVHGEFTHFGLIENLHVNHILDISIAPARVPPAIHDQAVELARSVFTALNVIGVLCIELFLVDEDSLLINELAPRPHNSGHLTVDAAVTSQFEQQLRAVCGLPLGDSRLLSPAVMANLLGDLWQAGEPAWQVAYRFPRIKFHLYGKREARPGRKMGHLTALHENVAVALEQARAARASLSPNLDAG